MKKLMFAAALAATFGIFADVESSNIVGYQGSTSGEGGNFIAVPFNSIGCNTADIQSIKISDDGAGTIGWGGEIFSIWEGVPTVREGSEFCYWDASYGTTGENFWGDGECNPATFSIANGQGVVIDCAGDLCVMTAGEVTDEQVSFTTVAGGNFTGNGFAAPLDIQSIKISDDGAGTIGWGGEIFSIWEGVPTVREGSEFCYWDASYGTTGENFWGDGECNPATYSITPGQGFVIDCAEGLAVTIDSPYSL